MRRLGLRSVRRGKVVRTTVSVIRGNDVCRKFNSVCRDVAPTTARLQMTSAVVHVAGPSVRGGRSADQPPRSSD